MANNKKDQSKTENKNKKGNESTNKKAQGSKTNTKPETVPTVEAEVVDHVIESISKKQEPAVKVLSPDSKVAFATLMQKRYIDHPDALVKYGQKFIDEIGGFIDGTVILTLLELREEAISKGVDVNLKFKNGVTAFQVTEACKMLGVTMPAPKLLTDGQQTIDFSKATVDENVQETLNNEKKVRKAIEEIVPELDPSKITTDEEVNSALEYQMRSTPNVLKSLVNTIEWLRNYRNFKAQSADEKLKLDDRTIGLWVDEILSLIKPTLLLTGIGRAVYVNAAQDGTPITAHCSVRKNIKDEDGKAILTEEQCAELVITLLKANAKFKLAKEPKEMKDKSIVDDRAIQNLVSGNEAMIDKIMAKEEDVDKKIYSIVLKQYYPNPEGDMTSKVRNKIGQLMNLYLPVEDRMENYPSISEESEYPESEEKAETESVEKKN